MWCVMFVVYILAVWVDLVTRDSYGRVMYGWIGGVDFWVALNGYDRLYVKGF
jgi:hypothetical protein